MIPDASKTSRYLAENVKMGPDASSAMPLDSKVPAENAKMTTDASTTIRLPSKVPAENVKEQTGKSNKQKFAQNRIIRKLEDINFQKDSSAASEPVPYGSRASVENIDDFQIEELVPVEDNQSKTQEESEAIMALDSVTPRLTTTQYCPLYPQAHGIVFGCSGCGCLETFD